MSTYPTGPLDYDNISAFLSAVDVIRDELITSLSVYELWDGYAKDLCKVSEISAHITGSTYCTITFNANGGVCETLTKYVRKGEAIGLMPEAALDGYTHLGWFTSASGGTQLNASTVINDDMTVYAQYMKSVMTLRKIGDVQVDDNMIASNFSNTSYLMSIDGDNINFSDGLELVFRARCDNSSPNQEIFGMTGAESFEFGAIGGKFMWEIATGSPTASATQCENGKWYYWRVVKTIGQFTYQCCFADGTTVIETPSYTTDCTATRSATVNGTFAVGIDYYCGGPGIQGEPWQGVIDLKNSYIKVNGQKVSFRIAT